MKEIKTMEGLPARRTALKVIRQVTEEGAYASLALDAALKNSGLSGADRRLEVIAKPDTDIKLKNILRLGACQILLEDRIPESAATNLCVQLCAETGMPGLKGVCNGILRNLIRRKDELKLPETDDETDQDAALRHSVPLPRMNFVREPASSSPSRRTMGHSRRRFSKAFAQRMSIGRPSVSFQDSVKRSVSST